MSRTVLITGSYRGMGRETARQLLELGMSVYVSARSLEKAESAVNDLPGDARPLSLDVTCEESVQNAMDEISSQDGKLDVLVNNAAVNPEFTSGSNPQTLTVEMLESVLDANFVGPFRVIQAATPLLAKGDDARIVNVASSLGSLSTMTDPDSVYYPFNLPAYNASKTALNALTVSYSKALESAGIAVVSVCPGWVKTEMGGQGAARTIDEGVRIIVDMATRTAPTTGTFSNEEGKIAW